MHFVSYSANLLLINVVLWLLMLWISKPRYTYHCPSWNKTNSGIVFFFVLYTLHCIFAFYEHDTYHYWNAFIAHKYNIYENVYNWLAKDVSQGNYFLWRIIIWIPACYLLYLTGKRLNCLSRNFMVAFVLLDIFIVANTRGSLGHAMLLYGAVLAMNEQSYRREKIIGLLLICLSFYFHKSIFVNIIFVILAIYPLKRKEIVALLIAFPFLTTAATYLIDNIILGSLVINLGSGMEIAQSRISTYAEGERMVSNIFGILGLIVQYAPVYVSLAYATYRIIYQKVEIEPIYIYMFRLAFVCIYIGSLFIFVDTSSWLSIRFRFMGMFPLPFVIGRLWEYDNKSNRWVKLIILLALFQNIWKFSYNYYSWS